MYYYDEQYLPEIYNLYHFNDSGDNNYVDYTSNILNKTLSPYLFGNDIMGNFLNKLQRPVATLFDNMNIIKNWKNYLVDKYYYKHAQ